MDNEQYKLSNLRDIFIPDPPPLWPPAPGVWVVLGLVVLALLFVSWRVYATRQRNAYRKAGLLLLSNANTTHDVSVVMKRVALAAFPREQVASLHGEEWAAFLRATCPGDQFPGINMTDTDTVPDQALVECAGAWIRHHCVPAIRPPTGTG